MNIADLYDRIRGHRVTTDTRELLPGDIFIALKGENFDGNDYIAAALQQGAFLTVSDRPELESAVCAVVPDPLRCLQELARHHRRELGIPILGITGTNGKTTTKELCHAVLSQKFRTAATQGNLNNHIGVPLTLLEMDETTEFGIVEMGASHPGEIEALCKIADPDFGLITNIGHAHLEGFGSHENIIATKKALYDHVFNKKGKVFVNADDTLLLTLSEGHERETYGNTGDCLKGEIKQTSPYLTYALQTLKGQLYIRTRLVGGYNFDNAMAASAIGLSFGIDPLKIRDAIEHYRPSNLRSQLLRTARNTVIVDAYNANPDSMQAAIDNFKQMPGEHKIAILGEMRELGEESAKAHSALVQSALEGHFDNIFLIGKNFEHYPEKRNSVTWYKDTETFIGELRQTPPENALILVKGSRANRLERITEYL